MTEAVIPIAERVKALNAGRDIDPSARRVYSMAIAEALLAGFRLGAATVAAEVQERAGVVFTLDYLGSPTGLWDDDDADPESGRSSSS